MRQAKQGLPPLDSGKSISFNEAVEQEASLRIEYLQDRIAKLENDNALLTQANQFLRNETEHLTSLLKTQE